MRRGRARRAVDGRDVDRPDLRLAAQIDRCDRPGCRGEGVGAQRACGRARRAGLEVARLRARDDEEVVVVRELAGRVGDAGQRVDHRLVDARPRELELGEPVEDAADLEALLVRLDRVFVAWALLRRVGRAIREADARRLEVVELAVAEVHVRERADLADVHDHVGLDRVLRLRRELAAVVVVDDVDRQRDREVLVDRVREVQLVVEPDQVAGAGLLERAVVGRARQEHVHERIDRAVRDRLRHAVALAVRVVVEDRPVELDRLRELRALVERVERVLEVRHAHAERVQLVLERIDELLQLVEIGFRGEPRTVDLQLRDDACDEHRHLVARQRTVAFELTVGIPLDQTVGRERLDRLIRPVVRRHVRERCRRGALTQRQERAHCKARCEDEGSETLHRFLRERCDVLVPLARAASPSVPTAAGTTTTRPIRNACRGRYTEASVGTPAPIKKP